MSNKSQYVLLNYDELNEKGLSKLVKEISKSGYKIAKVVPAGNGRKKDGIMTRTFSLVGIDEQTMEIQVNDTGDISGVKLNGKIVPFKPVKTLAALGQSIAALFNRGATSFQKTLARKLARAAKNIDEDNKKRQGVKSNAQKLAEAKQARDSIREDIAQAKGKLTQVQANSDKATQEIGNVKAALAQEQAQTRSLKEEIARLEDEA
ncbi:hypothetical protein [Escherichia fergusonii]|uniref:defense against restriction DarA-related protein n=1 Tax=Escherichia fergusonii TaxID=564 RepID=UPI0024337D3D|nr:hypothetical protein [Escherichia fergusonii]WGA68637.1 hypothetical protein NFL02_22835 [Escherichia fergusonii]